MVPAAGEVASGLELVADVAMSVAGKVIESSGLFEALGLGGPDRYTKEKLSEIVAKLDRLSGEVEALRSDVTTLRDVVELESGEKAIKDAYNQIIETCYRHTLVATATNFEMAMEARNDALLARAYQVASQPVPSELGSIDLNCSIQPYLDALISYVDPEKDSPIDLPFFRTLAKVAREKGAPFDQVASYFAWVVGIERQALAIRAQAFHRLGQDSAQAAYEASMRDSLRRQEVELLRAAEVYVAYQGVNEPFDGSPLGLADLIVARMEGITGFVTESLIIAQPSLDPGSELASLRVGMSMPIAGVALGEEGSGGGIRRAVPLDDTFSVDPQRQGYGLQQPAAVDPSISPFPYPYVLQLSGSHRIELGSGETITVARWRTTRVTPWSSFVTLDSPSAPVQHRTLALQGRNAASLEVEWTDAAGRASNPLDRLLLAHEAGDQSPMSGLMLLPSAGDPRRVSLAVDEPSRQLSSVTVGAGGAGFAARPGLTPILLEMVPAGPDTPERFAFRLEDGGWLGIAPSASPGGAYTVVETAQQPAFWFDVVPMPSGDGYQVSYVDAGSVRRFLYVNEQIVTGLGWQAKPRNKSVPVVSESSPTPSRATIFGYEDRPGGVVSGKLDPPFALGGIECWGNIVVSRHFSEYVEVAAGSSGVVTCGNTTPGPGHDQPRSLVVE